MKKREINSCKRKSLRSCCHFRLKIAYSGCQFYDFDGQAVVRKKDRSLFVTSQCTMKMSTFFHLKTSCTFRTIHPSVTEITCFDPGKRAHKARVQDVTSFAPILFFHPRYFLFSGAYKTFTPDLMCRVHTRKTRVTFSLFCFSRVVLVQAQRAKTPFFH